MAPENGNAFKRVWAWVGHYSKEQTVIGLATSLGVTSKAISIMPGGWHPPQYWALAGVWFFGTWAVVLLATRAIEWGWAKTHPATLHLVVHGGADVSISCCPSQSGDFYGTGWLEGDAIIRKKPFHLSWGTYTGQYKRIRGGDKTTLAIAGCDGHQTTYGSDPHLHIFESSQIGEAYAESWPLKEWLRKGPTVDLPWIDLRIELRAKQLPDIWKYRYRFRLTKDLEFEVEEL